MANKINFNLLKNGSTIRLKDESEKFTIEQINYDREQCWAESEFGGGWYINIDHIATVISY